MQVYSRSSAVEKFAARPVAGEVRVINQRHCKWRSCSQAQVVVSLLHLQETNHLDRPEPLFLKVQIRTRVLQDVRQHKLVSTTLFLCSIPLKGTMQTRVEPHQTHNRHQVSSHESTTNDAGQRNEPACSFRFVAPIVVSRQGVHHLNSELNLLIHLVPRFLNCKTQSELMSVR